MTTPIRLLIACMLFVIIDCFADDASIRALVDELGAAGFEKRERAEERLKQMGRRALPALEKACERDDPEIKLRARKLVKTIRMGISSDWSEDLVAMARGYDDLSAHGKRGFLRRLVNEQKADALSFLMERVREGDSADAAEAVKLVKELCEQDSELWEVVSRRIKPIGNTYQGSLLRGLLVAQSDVLAIADALDSEFLEKDDKRRLKDAAVRIVRNMFAKVKANEKQLVSLFRITDDLVKADMEEARFLYLHGLVLAMMNHSERAEKLAAAALALNPDDEGAHFRAGDFLMDLGQHDLALEEWKTILEIPPENEVYDINAYMRLGSIYKSREQYGKALQHYEKGLALYKAAKSGGGSGMGLIGGDALNKEMAFLREQVEQQRRKNTKVKIGNASFTVGIETRIVADQRKAYEDALLLVAASFELSIEPVGVRLFENAGAEVTYDVEKKEVLVLLNGRPCCEPLDLPLHKNTAEIGVHTLDMTYIFHINARTGKATRKASFEKDYVLTIVPENQEIGESDTLFFNEDSYTWEAWREGVELDYLPAALKLELKRAAASPQTEEGSKRVETFEPERFLRD